MLDTPASRPDAFVPVPAGRGGSIRGLAASARRRLTPLDVFASLNLGLFACMCAFTYYHRFITYRGSANLWEFFLYATVIATLITVLWMFSRRYAFGTGLLALVQAGIVMHFAGGFFQFDGYRLYDCYLAGIRYDKYVHFSNAIIAALVVRHVLVRRGTRMDALNRLFLLLIVLGLGAVVEIVEYCVWKTVPGNGVGGYDNNMQDLIANMAGTTLAVVSIRATPRTRRLHLAEPVHGERDAERGRRLPASERALSAAELVALLGACAAIPWLGPSLLHLPLFVPVAQLAVILALLYIVYLSPVRLHHDTLAERGLGSWRTLFVRTDNLAAAARPLALFSLAGVVGILLLAEAWNPGWLARANWKAWGVKLGVYSVSVVVQAFAFLAFGLVRVARVLMPSAPPGALAQDVRVRLAVTAVAALIFAAAHAPGPAQMALAAVFGAAVTWISLRTPNLFATAACWLLLGLLVHRVLGLSMRPGLAYYHPDIHLWRTIIPMTERWIGNLF